MKKEQLLIITHTISFEAQGKPRKQPYLRMPVKRQFSWEPLTACVSLIPLNLKTVIKSLFSLCFSRLNKPSSLDFHHRADFSNLFINSGRFLWILSRFCIMSVPGAVGDGIAGRSLRVTFLHLHSVSSLCEPPSPTVHIRRSSRSAVIHLVLLSFCCC